MNRVTIFLFFAVIANWVLIKWRLQQREQKVYPVEVLTQMKYNIVKTHFRLKKQQQRDW